MRLERIESPNFNDRRTPIDMLVLHYTGMQTGAAALERMCDPAAEVSAHYMVSEDGRIYQLVDEDKRAWHAGVASWQGDTDLNSHSIGIEIVNGGHDWPLPNGELPEYPDAQIEAVIALSLGIIERHKIPNKRIVGHSDIAPARKLDPGEHFPWARLSREGVGVWPIDSDLTSQRTLTTIADVQKSLHMIGYGIELTGTLDDLTQHCISAFQRRWLPGSITGELTTETLAMVGAIERLMMGGA